MKKQSKRIIGTICALALIIVITLLIFCPRVEEPVETTSPTEQIIEEPTSEPTSEPTTEPTRSQEEIEAELKQKEEEERRKNPILFSKDITFNYSWVSDGEHMPYALYSPSCADEYDEIPLIVWLHGSGEKGVSERAFRNGGLPAVIENWSLEGFNAYVLCPQLYGAFNTGSWSNPTSMKYLKTLLDIFISEHNVNTDKIYISGHSLGGQGCLYMTHELPDYLAACVSTSPYVPGVDLTEVEIPVIAYVGSTAYGEDGTSYQYALRLQDIFGEGSVTVLPTYHGGVPSAAFNLDEDGNGQSDLIEWLFSISKEDG